MQLPIAVDAMGGDHAPAEIVRGALRAVNEHGIAVTLVGRREAVEQELRSAGAATPDGISVVDAREVIEMNEHPANAVRAKRDSSLVSSCATSTRTARRTRTWPSWAATSPSADSRAWAR